MNVRNLLRRAAALAIVLLVLLVGGPAQAGDRVHQPLKRAYAGRVTTLAGVSAIGFGLTAMGVGHGLGVYDYRGPWWDKAAYDEAFRARSKASQPLFWTGVGIGASGVPVLATGVVVEAYGLRKVRRVSVVPGWLGLSFLSVAPGFLPLSPAITIGLASTGLACSFVQLALNASAEAKLDDDTHHQLYDRPHRPVIAVIPTLREGGGGVAVVGLF
jgi:hypothetical protein